MSKNDNFDVLNRVIASSQGTSVTARLGKYFLDSQGEDIENTAIKYVETGETKANLTRFVSKVEEAITNLIKEKKVEGLLLESKKAIHEMAQSRRIPLSQEALRDRDYPDPEAVHIGSGLNFTLKGSDELTYTKESLKWVNCLIEFYDGKPLFKDESQIVSGDMDKFETSGNTSEAIVSNEALKQQLKEEIVLEMLQQGYLQCDRT